MDDLQAIPGNTFPTSPPKTVLTDGGTAPQAAIDPARLRFLFEKELQKTDVGHLNRIIIPKRSAEEHLPALGCKDEVLINLKDMDGSHEWKLRFKFWLNKKKKSRIYLFENTGEFIDAHGLSRGDSIALYQDMEKMNYVIHARKAGEAAIASHDGDEARVMSSMGMFPAMGESVSSMSFIYDTTNFAHDSPFDFLNGPTVGSRQSDFGSLDNFSFDDFPL